MLFSLSEAKDSAGSDGGVEEAVSRLGEDDSRVRLLSAEAVFSRAISPALPVARRDNCLRYGAGCGVQKL